MTGDEARGNRPADNRPAELRAGARLRSEQEQRGLAEELERRTNNVLSAVQSIAIRTLVEDRPIEEIRDLFLDRLHAVGRAYAALDRGRGLGASLRDVIRTELEQYAADAEIEGPPLTLAPSAIHPLALIVHELAAGSARQGALSVPHGKILVRWNIDTAGEPAPRFHLHWTERGGPRPQKTDAAESGDTLIEKLSAAYGIEGRADYSPWGLRYDIEAPLSVIGVEQVPRAAG